MTRIATAALGVMLLASTSCKKSDALALTSQAIRFSPTLLAFGNLYVGQTPVEKTFSVINEGRSTVTDVNWEGMAPPLTAELPTKLPAGETAVAVQFSPVATGKITFAISVAGMQEPLTVTANGMAVPTCTPSADCLRSKFDVELGTCVESQLADGVACDTKSVCIVNGQCVSGRCIGEEKTCSDGDACTVDVCTPTTGCEFLPRPPCPGDGECLVGVCNPETGCDMAPADDGTTCGSIQTCKSAQVCVTGQCVLRNPPEGYLCAEASPCQGQGRCLNDLCVRSGPQNPLTASWSFDGRAVAEADGGTRETQLHDFVLEPSGAMTLSGFFQSAAWLRANTPGGHAALDGPSRRCILWNGRVVCADYPAAPNGRVTAMDVATGEKMWTFDIRAARPDFVDVTSQIFLARLVVQAGDRLAAIFEAYPKRLPPNTPTGSQCRSYFLVVMNAQGQLVMSSPLIDPLLAACNHPHPYGAVSDAVGNLFLAFSPTVSAQAPLKPGRPTLMLSYTRDGIFRWKVTDPSMEGGELAVARGLLYPENGSVVRTAATGAEAFAVPQTLGRIVVADSRFIPAPIAGQQSLKGFEAGKPSLSWAHQLQPSARFWSDQLRLATWATSQGPETVALAFIRDETTLESSLRAIRVHDGSEAFTCPLAQPMRTPPQLFEIANGSMGVMEGALDPAGQPGCGKCDPPFAGSAAAFHSFKLEGISVPKAPWVGTFGGAGHDHREEVDPASPGNASN